ncbi:hypothetical protein F5I97DRAFT_778552 [Phlebopus sp. FC_14]|nr:hypothetical protein F5I97DRAFT_778552 [Phlebopus sp. FC_14]
MASITTEEHQSSESGANQPANTAAPPLLIEDAPKESEKSKELSVEITDIKATGLPAKIGLLTGVFYVQIKGGGQVSKKTKPVKYVKSKGEEFVASWNESLTLCVWLNLHHYFFFGLDLDLEFSFFRHLVLHPSPRKWRSRYTPVVSLLVTKSSRRRRVKKASVIYLNIRTRVCSLSLPPKKKENTLFYFWALNSLLVVVSSHRTRAPRRRSNRRETGVQDQEQQ